MKRNPDLYRASVRVMLYRGPNYRRSLAFQVPHIPQDGLVDVWLEAFVARFQEEVKTWTEPSAPS
jgi:hypothetical protein